MLIVSTAAAGRLAADHPRTKISNTAVAVTGTGADPAACSTMASFASWCWR
jgi:hypothetical protein